MTEAQEKQFHKERLSGLGGTDIGAILGVNPYKGPMQVYREKMGLHTEPMNEAMHWGIAMEPLIADRAKELIDDRSGGKLGISRDNLFVRHPEHDCLIAHLDAWVVNGSPVAVLECKTANDRMRTQWGEPWSDDIPRSYLVQVQHQLNVTGLSYAYVAVLFGNREFQIFEVMRNDDLIGVIIEKAVNFWQYHIQAQVPPPVDGSESSAKMLKEMYPADTGGEIEATEKIAGMARMFCTAQLAKKQAEKNMAEARNQIIEFMGDNAILTGDDFRVTYKKSKDGETTAWSKLWAKAIKEFGINPELAEALRQDFVAVKTGSRRFLPKFQEE